MTYFRYFAFHAVLSILNYLSKKLALRHGLYLSLQELFSNDYIYIHCKHLSVFKNYITICRNVSPLYNKDIKNRNKWHLLSPPPNPHFSLPAYVLLREISFYCVYKLYHCSNEFKGIILFNSFHLNFPQP